MKSKKPHVRPVAVGLLVPGMRIVVKGRAGMTVREVTALHDCGSCWVLESKGPTGFRGIDAVRRDTYANGHKIWVLV